MTSDALWGAGKLLQERIVMPPPNGPFFREELIELDSIIKEEKMKKKLSASLKLKITIEALKGDMTIGEIASRYEVSPAQIHR